MAPDPNGSIINGGNEMAGTETVNGLDRCFREQMDWWLVFFLRVARAFEGVSRSSRERRTSEREAGVEASSGELGRERRLERTGQGVGRGQHNR